MLLLLSPAKSLDYESPLPDVAHSEPLFVSESVRLIRELRKYKPAQIAELMDLSDDLSRLNVARYKAWRRTVPQETSRPAVLAFDGDVYGGLQARALSPDDLHWMQEHVAILSGLYGVLRPLDRMQPYRLEMKTRLPNERGANLYQFWGPRIAQYLNRRLAGEADPLVVNLASQEYFRAVDRKALKARVVECVFEETRGERHQVISFLAKRARGLMARHVVRQRARTVEQLESFDAEGYALVRAASTPERLVFRRNAPT
ncbi:MAG: peroxide stress protein YaaA [Burkholderiaceae bacterium]|nr:peroxide stress protein YaaA [Rhodoferax sp.]